MSADLNDHRPHACAFATALDREDYPAARILMADECLYRFRNEEIRGADAIIASYRSHGEKARKRFDEVVYESEVEMTGPDSAILHYTDRIAHQGKSHVHRCRQHIELNPGGLVCQIVHQDLEGEAERLTTFKSQFP